MECTVHPHACGENDASKARTIYDQGSSPRVWGKPIRKAIQTMDRRFIPTRVGKTRCRRTRKRLGSVHPHACGENARWCAALLPGIGSSPRVWGKQFHHFKWRHMVRFIPTRVGKTRTSARHYRHLAVHPHACGENSRTRTLHHLLSGSSPRVWGKRDPQYLQSDCERFIPTRVGKTLVPILPAQVSRFIPTRVGKTPIRVDACKNLRFIPTRVGKTLSFCLLSFCPPVHPHACGENATNLSILISIFGSSPRVWGKRAKRPVPLLRSRFIPTRVGKTWQIGARMEKFEVHPHACGENALTYC